MVMMVLVGGRLRAKDGGVKLLILYEARADLAFFKSRSGTQESSSAEYPFHRIRKEQEDGVPQWHMIFSILYSSSPSIRSGGGAGKFLLWTSFSQ